MSEQNHPWCRDTARDEAIRRAEDDAANWRRLEVGEVIEAGDEYLDERDGWKRVPHSGMAFTRHLLPHRRRRVPLPDHRDLPAAVAELRERVARIEAFACAGRMNEFWCAEPQPAPPAPPQPSPVPPPDGLRTERVTLEIKADTIIHSSQWRWTEILRGADVIGSGESVRVVKDATIGSGDEIVRLTAERDAAIRERDAARAEVETYRGGVRTLQGMLVKSEARVAELENASAPAANAGGGSNQSSAGGVACGDHGKAEAQVAPSRSGSAVTDGRPAANAEPVAWALAWVVWGRGTICGVTVSREDASAMQRGFAFDTELLPLYNAPQTPRSWLTPAERACIEELLPYTFSGAQAKTLTMLLARSTPPRVRRPKPTMVGWDTIAELFERHDAAWIAAIRAAGGEVE